MPAVDLIATIPVPQEKLAQARDMLLAYGEFVRAEPANERFEVYLDAAASALVVVERYASQEGFEAHLGYPENADFNARLGDLLAGGGSSLQMLERLG